MQALRGKVSNLSAISKILNSGSCLSKTPMADNSALSVLIGLRYFGSNDRGKFGKFGMKEASDRRNDDDDDQFFANDSGKFNARPNGPRNPISGRPLRGERRLPPFQQPTNNSRRRVRDDSDQFSSRQRFSKPVGRKSGNVGSKRSDDFFLSDDDEGNLAFGKDGGKKQNSEPSISEFLRRGIKGEQENVGENSDFLEQFKLSGAGRKEADVNKNKMSPPPEEEKAEEPPQDADAIFKKMKETGLIPNAVSMLDGLCKDGLVQEAMKLFGLMREKGTMPEVVIYTAVVDGFCQAHKLDDAKRIFRKMQTNGIIPNAFSYTVLIKGLCKGKRLEDAVDFCVEMLEAGHSPNISTFTGLVDEFCTEKGVEEAQKVIGALKQKGFYFDEKAVRDHLDKKGPSSSMVWDAIFGPNKTTQQF